MIFMQKENKQIEEEIAKLKSKLDQLAKSDSFEELDNGDSSISMLVKYMLEEREKTNRMLKGITEKVRKIEEEFKSTGEIEEGGEKVNYKQMVANREIPLSSLDSKILEFAQAKGMVCADDVKELMQYRGKNAACARLNKLYRAQLLDRFQLGHRVYFKYDAGKTTNTLIISPPQ